MHLPNCQMGRNCTIQVCFLIKLFILFDLFLENFHNNRFISIVLHRDKLLLIGSSVSDLIVLFANHSSPSPKMDQTNQTRINPGRISHTILVVQMPPVFQTRASHRIHKIQINREFLIRITNLVGPDGELKSTTS